MYHNEREKNISSLELINTPVFVNSEISLVRERRRLSYYLFSRAKASVNIPQTAFSKNIPLPYFQENSLIFCQPTTYQTQKSCAFRTRLHHCVIGRHEAIFWHYNSNIFYKPYKTLKLKTYERESLLQNNPYRPRDTNRIQRLHDGADREHRHDGNDCIDGQYQRRMDRHRRLNRHLRWNTSK